MQGVRRLKSLRSLKTSSSDAEEEAHGKYIKFFLNIITGRAVSYIKKNTIPLLHDEGEICKFCFNYYKKIFMTQDK